MNPTIRDAVPLDRPMLVRLMAELQDYERSLHPNRTDGWAIASVHLAYLEQHVKAHQGRLLIAESSDGPLGFLVCFKERLDEGDLHVIDSERQFGYISDLYVVPEARSKGIAAALIRAAEDHFKHLGLTKLRVTVLAKNDIARHVYEQTQFRPYELTYEKSL